MPEWLSHRLHPREGWLSLLLLAIMLVALGWSVQRAGWLDRLDFVIPVAGWALLVGTLLALTEWTILLALPIGAACGAWVVLASVGSEYVALANPGGQIVALREQAVSWLLILLERGTGPQQAPWALVLGMVLWASAFVAAFAVYRHHRVLDAILLIGALLVINLSATFADLFGYMVLFSLAALLLWLRAALVSRQEGWSLRRVNQNADVPGSIMRSGVGFILGAIALSWTMTSVAIAAPLTGVWNSIDPLWSDLRGDLDALFGNLGTTQTRFPGSGFASRFTISESFTGGDQLILRVGAQRGYYLRTVTYDQYTGHGWVSSDGIQRRVAAGDPIFPGPTPERPYAPDAFEVETITVSVMEGVGRSLFTHGYPIEAFVPVLVSESGGVPVLGQLEAASVIDVGTGYQITAAVSRATEAQLAGASIVYPAEISALYLDTTGITQRTIRLAQSVSGLGPSGDPERQDPYHLAKSLAAYLNRDPAFRYANNATLPDDPERDLVDFFLFDSRAGFCEYFASAMVMMARSLGIPARMAVGYAPGERVEAGVYEVRGSNSHAWAELYFPAYGWQVFEATKSIPPVVRAPGVGVAPPVNPPAGGGDPPDLFPGGVEPIISSLPSYEPATGGFIAGEEPPPVAPSQGNGVLVLVGVLALIAFGAWRWIRARRSFRFLAPADVQWQRLALAANRAGVSRSSSETIYEYAGWLEEQLPAHRVDIRAIADGKVLQSYSGRWIGAEAVRLLERAWRRLQLPLVWLAVRRQARALLRERI